MKRNINDYKDTKTAIEVNSIEEFDKIKKLLKHKQQGNLCLKNVNLDELNYCVACDSDDYGKKDWWLKEGFTIYSANDFLEEESKFEAGRWYKVGNQYTKFLILQNKSSILGSEHIYDNEHHMSKIKSGTCIFKLSDNPVLLTDLSEIQEFLPDNHPDKIKIEIIPEYVEYIDTKYKGQIVKVEEWTIHSFCCIRFENGQREQPFKHLVKSSTKDAYEAQNKPKQLTVDDLIEGEIYFGKIKNGGDIIFKPKVCELYSNSSNVSIHSFAKRNNFDQVINIRLTTNKEKKWLNTCISQDKFIPKEDLHLYDDNGLLIWEIGCYYKLNFTDSTSTYIKLSKKIDDRIFGNEYTDSTGKWYYSEIIWSTKQLKTHEKVDKPNQKKEAMFKKNDYIVVLYNDNSLNSWTNQCFKQLEDLYYLKVVKNLNGNTDGWSVINFKNQSKWRYASSAEILEYERIGKPFDVTTLIKKEKSLVKQVQEGLKLKDRWVKCVKECGWNTINVGEYIQILENNSLVPYVEWKDNKEKYCIDLDRIDKAEFELMPEGFSPNEKEWIPKVGDWVYAEKSSSKDWRIDKYIPLFQVKEIKYGYLRPEKDVAEGIDIEFCRKALPNEIPIEQQSIKQYPLTKEECFIDLKNTKIWIGDNPELSRKVQEIAMHLGSIIHNQYPLTPIESFQASIYDLKDIYIAPIIKKETKIQTTIIESSVDLNLNLTKIKSKQIQTIKI